MKIVEQNRQLDSLTGARFIAALMVFLFHYGASAAKQYNLPGLIVNFFQNGYLGVSIFFILSGFIITYTYDGKLVSTQSLRIFWIARLARMYPVYALALLVTLPFVAGDLTTGSITSVITMTQAWTLPTSGFGYSWLMQAWTLSIELFFYLVTPILFFVFKGLKGVPLRCAMTANLAVIVGLSVPTMSPGQTTFPVSWMQLCPIPGLRLIEFVFGLLLCKLFRERSQSSDGRFSTLLISFEIIVFLVLISITKNGHIVSAAIVVSGFLLLHFAEQKSGLFQFLSSPAMIKLGAASYALYLLQWPIRAYVGLLPWQLLAQVLNPFIAITVSLLVYRFWEEPARMWLRTKLSGKQRVLYTCLTQNRSRANQTA